MIIVRSPLRISLGGGGTDLPSYYSKKSGFVISAAINKYVYVTILSLIGLILGTAYVGIYISLIFFLFFYLKFFSEKSTFFITVFSLATPVITFCFFEWLLKITLPQGISEPLFYPIYDLMY